METLPNGSVHLSLEYILIASIIFGIVTGVVCGLPPLIFGFLKKKLKLGVIGFVLCLIIALPFSLLGALLISIIFSVIITGSKRLAVISGAIAEIALGYVIFALLGLSPLTAAAAAFGVGLGFTLLSLLFARLIGKTEQLWIYTFLAVFSAFYLTEAAFFIANFYRLLTQR